MAYQAQQAQRERQEREWIREIWRGHVPAYTHLGHLPLPDLNNFAQYTFNQLVIFMGDFPHLADAIFQWGRSPVGPWMQHAQFPNENALLGWHADRSPNVNFPLSQAQINANTQGMRFPINQLIQLDRVDTLSHLHRAGHWDPLGYTATGASYLSLATTSVGPKLTLHYILYLARRNPHFASRPVVSTLLTATPNTENHLDFLIRHCPHTVFTAWWRHLWQPTLDNNMAIRLTEESQRTLCRRATNEQAALLRQCAKVDIGQVDMDGQTGSVWHLALENHNTDIMDFLRGWAPQNTINLYAGHSQTPLECAKANGLMLHFEKLLAVGAECDVMVRTDLAVLPRANDKWLIAALVHYRNINPPPPGGNVQSGTLLHTVLDALHGEKSSVQNNIWLTPAQKARRRKALVGRAKRHIQLVRAGSRYGRPDLTTRNAAGATALAMAHEDGFFELEGALQINPLPQVAQGGNPPAPARGHRYQTRRAARLRGT
ncbi:uncharacterized protein BDV17DRAFT_288975 [Aspergillus undulatus]|uniref:uncharacterized protein n=1 Tax=Aspergillus undulatus TaxID=1810928 RepID=UPI003CCCAE1F